MKLKLIIQLISSIIAIPYLIYLGFQNRDNQLFLIAMILLVIILFLDLTYRIRKLQNYQK